MARLVNEVREAIMAKIEPVRKSEAVKEKKEKKHAETKVEKTLKEKQKK